MGAGGSSELPTEIRGFEAVRSGKQAEVASVPVGGTQTLTLKGEQKPPKSNLCSYGPNGQIQKVPIDQQQAQQSGRQGRLKQRVIEKKTEEMQDYMGQVKGVLSMYVPPDAQRMQQAFQAHTCQSCRRRRAAAGL